MRCLLVLPFIFSLLFCVSAQAEDVRNSALGFSLSLPAGWRLAMEEPFVFEGQDFHAAYWCEGELGSPHPYILVRSVETGMVPASDIVGLNKIAVQSSLNGMRPEDHPEVVDSRFYPKKALFAYAIESDGAKERVRTNKYVYYTRRGMLEFSMVCNVSDYASLANADPALRAVRLVPQMRYQSVADAKMELASVIVPDGAGSALLPIGFVLAMGVLGFGLFRSR